MTTIAIDTLHYAKAGLNEAGDRLGIGLRDVQSSLIRWSIPVLPGQTAATVALIKLL